MSTSTPAPGRPTRSSPPPAQRTASPSPSPAEQERPERRAPAWRRWRARRGPGSLRSRVAWSATAVTAGWVLALGVGGDLLVAASLSRAADDSLLARAEAASAAVQIGPDGLLSVIGPGDDRALVTGTWVVDAQGVVVKAPWGAEAEATDGAEELARQALEGRGAGPEGSVASTVDLDDPVRLVALPVQRGGDAVGAVVTSASLNPYARLRDTAVLASAVAGLGLLVVVHLVLRAALGRALAPVAQMSSQVDRWSTDDPEQRLGQQDRPTELAELSGTLDGLLARIAAVLRHERLLTAELSHELRTPLAQLQAELDWLRAGERSPQEREESLAALDASAARMHGVIDALLASARTSTAVPGRCDVAAAVRTAVEEVTGGSSSQAGHVSPAGPGGPEVSVAVPAGLLAGVESAVLERAVAPLLANALRHARQRVVVSARRDDHDVVVSVRDDGDGIPAHLVERVLEPGFRADPADGHDGAGLGLALAHRLASGAGGAVVPRPAGASGGGVVELVLPGS